MRAACAVVALLLSGCGYELVEPTLSSTTVLAVILRTEPPQTTVEVRMRPGSAGQRLGGIEQEPRLDGQRMDTVRTYPDGSVSWAALTGSTEPLDFAAPVAANNPLAPVLTIRALQLVAPDTVHFPGDGVVTIPLDGLGAQPGGGVVVPGFETERVTWFWRVRATVSGSEPVGEVEGRHAVAVLTVPSAMVPRATSGQLQLSVRITQQSEAGNYVIMLERQVALTVPFRRD